MRGVNMFAKPQAKWVGVALIAIALIGLPQFLAERPIYGDINRRFLRWSEAELREYLVRDLARAGAARANLAAVG